MWYVIAVKHGAYTKTNLYFSSLTINEFLDNIEQYYSRKRGDHGACEYFARGELAQIGTENKISIRESVEKRNKEYQFMNQQILADIPAKVYELAQRAEQMEKQLEQLEEAYFDSYTDASQEDAAKRADLKSIIAETKNILTEQLDWFDIYEFLHQAGASGELLSSLSGDDLTAVSQCEIGLYRLIIRFTKNCSFTEQLVLSTLQWFEYFKQYYKCIIKHETPPPTTKLELKPPGQEARNTFLLQSLSNHQCLTHSGLDL